MALTKEDLQAISSLVSAALAAERENTQQIVQQQIEPIKTDVTVIKEDIAEIKEDTTVTRSVVNDIGAWTEVASDVLKIRYPLQKAE